MSAPIRAQQLAAIFPMLQDSDRTVLMGDFNFCSSWQAENAQIDSSYQDLWMLLKQDEPGYTEDTDINLMRLEQKGKKRHVCFDRILFRCNYSGWYPHASYEAQSQSPLLCSMFFLIIYCLLFPVPCSLFPIIP